MHTERGKLHPHDTWQGRKVYHHHRQWMITAHLLGAKGRQDQQPDPCQPAAQEPQNVQRRLVSPVDVFEQQQHR